MAKRSTRGRTAGKTSVHVTISPDVAARLRAFAGWHGRELGDVVEEGLRLVLKGFSVRQDQQGPRLAAGVGEEPPAAGTEGRGQGQGRGAA